MNFCKDCEHLRVLKDYPEVCFWKCAEWKLTDPVDGSERLGTCSSYRTSKDFDVCGKYKEKIYDEKTV